LELEGSLNTSSLSHSIQRLINASTTLDHQTESEVKKLHKLLPSPPPHPPHKHHDGGKKPLKLVWYKFCSAFSSKCERKLHKHHPDHHGHPELDFPRRRSQRSRRSWRQFGLEIRRDRHLKVVSSLRMASRYIRLLADVA
jgi:hypothetical protein